MTAFFGSTHLLETSSLPTNSDETFYFPNQSAFNFFPGFGMVELKILVEQAEKKNERMVWVPQSKHGSGKIGLSIWYIKALFKEYEEN